MLVFKGILGGFLQIISENEHYFLRGKKNRDRKLTRSNLEGGFIGDFEEVMFSLKSHMIEEEI